MPKSQFSKSFSVHTHGEKLKPTQKLQKEADYYTKKYQWQRRNLITLQNNQANLQREVSELKKNIAKLKKQSQDGKFKLQKQTKSGKSKKIPTYMKSLQKQIDINDKRYNDTLGQIQNLKQTINKLRQQKIMYQNNLKSLEDDISKLDQEITHLLQTIESSQNNSIVNQNIMLTLKMKNQEDKNNYYRKLNQLNKQLKDPKLNKISRIKAGQVNAIQNDTSTILKQRLTKLIINNKEKVKLIDNYQKNMKVIDEAFTTIKQATGLTDIQQIQTTFIKGQQQNYNLLTYVDVLNQQIDNLMDNNQSLELKNEQLRKQNSQKQRLLNGTPDDEKKKQKIQQYITEKQKVIQNFQSMLNQIQPLMKQVLIKLSKSKFNRNNPHKTQQYINSEVTLNDSNLDQYLAQLQTYTNAILVYRGKTKNQSNAQIYAKTLLLDQLSPKEFKKKINDNTPLYNVLEDAKDKTKGIDKLLDRNTLEDMAKKQLDNKKNVDALKKDKKK